MKDPVPSGPGCGWPDRAQTGAPPTPPLPRAETSNAGARARRPQPPHCLVKGKRPASCTSKQGAPRPQAGIAS